MLVPEQGKVLPLISQSTNDDSSKHNNYLEFILHEETLNHIVNRKGEYCFISVCGDYRSGKSFLMNSLFFDCSGFDTSSNT